MWKLRKYVSNKDLFSYIVIYILYKITFLLSPYLSGIFIDASVAKDFDKMILYAIYNIILFVAGQGVMYFFDIIEGEASTRSTINIYEKLDDNLLRYNLKTNNISRDKINQEITHNLDAVSKYIFKTPVNVVFQFLTMIFIFVIMLTISVQLAFVMLISVPVGAYVSYKLGDKISDYSEENIQNTQNINGYILDKYEINKSERLLDKKQLFNIKDYLDKYKNTLFKKFKLQSLVENWMIYFILNGVILMMTILSGYYVFNGSISIGAFFASQLYVSQFWGPVQELFDIRNEYLSDKPAINNFAEFLEIEAAKYKDDKIKTIELKDFECLSKDNTILNEKVNASFDASHINIICGDNGTGKTTIVEAILNYNKRYKGKIYINGEEVKDLSYSDIVYIPADYLISKFGVLEDKAKVSSGQRKKAQFDLSLLTDKSVYIIDEPTNFLDLENKEAIAKLISDLHDKGKIIIMITHDKDIMNKLNNVETIYLERKVVA